MDDIGSSIRKQVLAENVEMLRSNGIFPTKDKMDMSMLTPMCHRLVIRIPIKKVFREWEYNLRNVTSL